MTRIALENEFFLISLHPPGHVRDSTSDGVVVLESASAATVGTTQCEDQNMGFWNVKPPEPKPCEPEPIDCKPDKPVCEPPEPKPCEPKPVDCRPEKPACEEKGPCTPADDCSDLHAALSSLPVAEAIDCAIGYLDSGDPGDTYGDWGPSTDDPLAA